MTTRAKLALWLVFSLAPASAASACGSSSQSNDGGTQDTGTDAVGEAGAPGTDAVGEAAAPIDGSRDASDAGLDVAPIKLTIGPLHPGANVEATQCVTLKLPNTVTLHAGSITTNTQGLVRPELTVSKVATGTESTSPADCPSASGMQPGSGMPLTITKKVTESVTFPAGDGMTLAPQQLIRLQLHGLDDGSGFGADVTFGDFVSDGQFQNEVGLIVVGPIDISISPGQGLTVNQTIPLPPATQGMFSLSSIQHKLGQSVTAAFANDAGVAGSQVYSTTNWEDPAVTSIAPTGAAQVALGCAWSTNNTGSTVIAGPGLSNEECYLRAHFAPASSSFVCIAFGGTNACQALSP